MWIVRRGNVLCGGASQDYGLERWNKSPDGRLAGQLRDGRFEIQFTDYFSDPSTQGAARLYVRNGKLVFEQFKDPPYSYLALSEGPLRSVPQAKPPTKSRDYRSCIAFTGDIDEYLSDRP